jgi:hypothetical protein
MLASGDISDGWYVRARGRVLGPLTWAQLQSLRDRGQLARFHEVSQDRQSWVGAESLTDLFPPAEPRRPPRSPDPAPTLRPTPAPTPPQDEELVLSDEEPVLPGWTEPTAQEAPTWFFARGSAPQGPIRFSELRRMADRGELGPDTPLWKSGMEEWVPGSRVAGLSFPTPAGAATGPDGRPSAHGLRREAGATVVVDLSPRLSRLAFAGVMLGLLWLCGLGSLAAIVLSVVALRQIARSEGALAGKSLAVAGLILGSLGLTLTLLGAFLAVFLGGSPD